MEIKGERVTLRETAREDLDDLMKLWNCGRVMKWVGFPDGLGYDRNDVETWFTKVENNPNRHHFVVAMPGSNFCGETYYAVDHVHQRASLDIKLIPEAQGQGLANHLDPACIRSGGWREFGVDAALAGKPGGQATLPALRVETNYSSGRY